MPWSLPIQPPLGHAIDVAENPSVRAVMNAFISRLLRRMAENQLGATAQQEVFLVQNAMEEEKRTFWCRMIIGFVADAHEEIWPGKSIGQIESELKSKQAGPEYADQQLQAWLSTNLEGIIASLIEKLAAAAAAATP